MKISILGAPGSGKTQLADELARHFQARAGTVGLIPDLLRQWCEHAGRMPRADELSELAREQDRRLSAADPASMLIADSTPLLGALCNGLLPGERWRHDLASDQPRRYDLTLLTGLDLPPAHGPRDSAASQQQEQADARLRAALRQAGMAYGVVYGSGAQRLRNALRLIVPQAQDTPPARWNGICEKCSDPECEFRLFTGLRDSRAAAHPSP